MVPQVDGFTKRMKWIRQQSLAAMESVARVMRAELILLLVLSLAAPAFAAYESGPVGPYNVSFDMNTTMKYTVIVEAPSSGVTSLGVNFARYNLTIDSADYLAWLVLTRYDEPMVANITANEYIVYNALLNAGADKPNLYQPLIDGKPGVLGNFRFERQFLGQGQYQEGDLVVAASYSPDARVYEDGVYRGRTDCRIISTYPWEIVRDLLYTLHVEVPKEEGAPIDQSYPATSSTSHKHNLFIRQICPRTDAKRSLIQEKRPAYSSGEHAARFLGFAGLLLAKMPSKERCHATAKLIYLLADVERFF